MLKTIIIADDNTGANASAILLNQLNFKSLSVIEYNDDINLDSFDAIAISTDSRAVEKTEAFNRVYNTLSSLAGVKPLLFNKRIDSTLRGNLGSEIEAFLQFFPNKKIAVVPSYPNSKRICKEGIIYVDGKKLEETDVAKDPKMPIFTSSAKGLIAEQSDRNIKNIYFDDLKRDELSSLIIDGYKNHDILIFDAVTNEDIDIVAKALVASKIDVISVDPGPFTYYYSKALLNHKNKHKYIFLVGSVVDTTYEQLKHISKDSDFDVIYANPNLLLDENKVNKEIERVLDLSINSDKQFICVTTTDVNNRLVLDLKEIAKQRKCSADDISSIINDHLAEILLGIIEKINDVSGVFCSGGDTSLGFLKKANAHGITLISEVLPLSVYGKVAGGLYNGLPIITKGGMIGEHNSYTTIKDFFKEEINNE